MSRATWPTNTTSGVEILAGDVDAGRSVGGAGPAGDETHARAAGRLADRLRHHRGAALLPAYGNRDVAVVKRVDRGQIAFARHAEHVLDAVNAQLIDQNFGGRAIIVLTAHRYLRLIPLPLVGRG